MRDPEVHLVSAEMLMIERGYSEEGLRQKCRDLVRERDQLAAQVQSVREVLEGFEELPLEGQGLADEIYAIVNRKEE